MKFPADVFKTAGFNTTDVAVLFDVTRVTASKWLRSFPVHVMCQRRVTDYAGTVARETSSGTLPWKPPAGKRTGASERAAHLKSIVQQARG